jgi:hypothetical protein
VSDASAGPFANVKPLDTGTQFLLDLPDLDAPPEELIGTLCVLAGETQPGAIVGGTIIDGASATFDRAVFPGLPDSFVSRLRRSPIAKPYIGTCAQAVYERKPVTCPNISTETRFHAGGFVCSSAKVSNRCNPLPYSASTERLLAPSSWRSMSQGPPLPSTWK